MDGYYAFMIVATALVLMMTTPALALFYGGMSRSKSVLNMMMMSYISLGSSASSTCCGAGRWPSPATTSAACSPTRSTLFWLEDVTSDGYIGASCSR